MSVNVTIVTFTETMFGENEYLVSVAGHDGVWVIDPSFERASAALCARVAEQNQHVESVVLTHGHADHVAGVDGVLRRWPQAGLLVAREDAHMLADAAANLSAPFGLDVRVTATPTGGLEPGTELSLGPSRWCVLDTSGHSPGGRSLYCADAGIVITGDALFAGSIGRTDFPGGSLARLVGNIREHLLTLPGATRVYSGHGPVTTIEKERMSNPYLAE